MTEPLAWPPAATPVAALPRTFRFGHAELDTIERVVRLEGHPLALGARAFDLLLALVERRDRTVCKHELMDLVWPDIVVEENNLAVQISSLRKVLGPQAIVTVPGRGYRFAMGVESPPSPRPPSASPGAATELPGPPLATHGLLAALPAAGALWGRDEDLAELLGLIDRGRLVTLVGAGGIGKTSLALAAAHRLQHAFRDGVAWIDLSEIREQPLVARAVAQGAGLQVVASQAPQEPLVEALRPLRMLLVLDNAEHVRDGVAALVQAILARAPHAQVVVTSQVPLKVESERLFRVSPLRLPDAGATAEQALANGAVALFVEQARAADRHFALTSANAGLVIDLCRRLDGVALAIKLAVARLPLLGLPGLAARLEDRLHLLNTGPRSAPTRQQTLQGALDWSHGLLAEREQRVFRRLAVFSGGFMLEMSGAAAGDPGLDDWQVIDALGELVDRSLVDVAGLQAPRYHLLETARAYAARRLEEAGERDATRARHAELLACMAETAYAQYWSIPERAWLDAWLPEIDNLRAAIEWSAAARPDLALRLAGAASVLFLLTGQAPESRRTLGALQGALADDTSPAVAARYWLERSRLHMGISGVDMREFAALAARHAQAAGDIRTHYMALRCAVGSGFLLPESAQEALGRMAAMEQPGWPERLLLQRRMAEMAQHFACARVADARVLAEEVLGRARVAQLDSVEAVARVQLAAAHLALDDTEGALRHARAHAASPFARRSNLVLQALATQANALLLRDRFAEARGAVQALVTASRSRAWEWFGLYGDLFALLAISEGRPEAAAMLLGHADATWRRAGARDLNTARAKARALARIQADLDAAGIARLGREGERLDAEAACALTLGMRP